MRKVHSVPVDHCRPAAAKSATKPVVYSSDVNWWQSLLSPFYADFFNLSRPVTPHAFLLHCLVVILQHEVEIDLTCDRSLRSELRTQSFVGQTRHDSIVAVAMIAMEPKGDRYSALSEVPPPALEDYHVYESASARMLAVPAPAAGLAEIQTEVPAFEVSAIAGPLRTAFGADLVSSTSSPPSSTPLSLSTDQQPAPTATRRRVSFAATSSPLLPVHFHPDSIGANMVQSGSGADPGSLKESSTYHSTAGRNSSSYINSSSSGFMKAHTMFKRNSVMPLPHGRMSAAFLQKLPTRKASHPFESASVNGGNCK